VCSSDLGAQRLERIVGETNVAEAAAAQCLGDDGARKLGVIDDKDWNVFI
jgi:enoyl-CoA hydratase/carnithine racemase